MDLHITVKLPENIENPRNLALAMAMTADAFCTRLGEVDVAFDVEDKEHDLWAMVLGYFEDIGAENDD